MAPAVAQDGAEAEVPEFRAVPDFHIRLDDAETRILLARVELSFSELILREGEKGPALTGTYAIEVPLRSSKNETGTMVLPLERELQTFFRDGGELKGRGMSFTRPGARREIVCTVQPADPSTRRGRLELEIKTEERVMHFDTFYEVVGAFPVVPELSPGGNAGGSSSASPASAVGN